MSLSRDRLTFFAVMIGVGVAVFGYLRLGAMYPTTGREEASAAGGEAHAMEEADHSDEEARERLEASDPGE